MTIDHNRENPERISTKRDASHHQHCSFFDSANGQERNPIAYHKQTAEFENVLSPHDLFERVLKSPGDQDLLGQVRKRANEVLVALENSESFWLSEDEMRSVDPFGVAEVYDAMAGSEFDDVFKKSPHRLPKETTRVFIFRRFTSTKISSAPGSRLLRLADFFCAPKTMSMTICPLIADWRTEYYEALNQRRIWKARWISFRYYSAFAKALCLRRALNLVKALTSARLGG